MIISIRSFLKLIIRDDNWSKFIYLGYPFDKPIEIVCASGNESSYVSFSGGSILSIIGTCGRSWKVYLGGLGKLNVFDIEVDENANELDDFHLE